MTNLKVVSKPEPVSFNDVLKTLKEYLESDTDLIASDIKPSDRLSYDLGLDSLNRLEMIIHIEKVYGIEIEDTTDLEHADTLAEFVALCKNKINQEKIVFQLGTKNNKFIP
ncbi:acyl carrier protein, partial [bacterium]|nr:acyl carrier protein [bacterium]